MWILVICVLFQLCGCDEKYESTAYNNKKVYNSDEGYNRMKKDIDNANYLSNEKNKKDHPFEYMGKYFEQYGELPKGKEFYNEK